MSELVTTSNCVWFTDLNLFFGPLLQDLMFVKISIFILTLNLRAQAFNVHGRVLANTRNKGAALALSMKRIHAHKVVRAKVGFKSSKRKFKDPEGHLAMLARRKEEKARK